MAHYLQQDIVLLADASARILGFVQFGNAATPDSQQLRRLYVHPRHQNEGIGSALMRAALDHPEMWRASRISVDVWEENAGARRLYEGLDLWRQVANRSRLPPA